MKYLSDYMRQAQTETFNKYGAFFAFSKKQFDESKKENMKYVSMGSGLICPKENTKKLVSELDKIYLDAIKLDVKENGAEKIIEREYFNYECQLTMDVSSALSSISGHKKEFPKLFTEELINATFKKCFGLAVENDWF